MPTNTSVIAMTCPVAITAAEGDGENKELPKFLATFYTGGAMKIEGWDLPVAIDLAGLEQGNVLVANLDHDRTKRVGNFTVANDGKTLIASGTASAATPWRDEVVQSAKDGYQWQASLEVQPASGGVELIKAGKAVDVNGQQMNGPLYVTRKGTLKGFAFVSHGADDATSAVIAATEAALKKGIKTMRPEVIAWVKKMVPSLDVESLTDEQKAGFEADYEGRERPPAPKTAKFGDAIAAKQQEVERVDAITEYTLTACDRRPYDIDAIKALAEQAIDGKWTIEKFRLELLEASMPAAHSVFCPRGESNRRISEKVVEAAICMSGNLKDAEEKFDDQTLQTAHDKFRNGIGLKQLMVMAAEANGYNGSSGYNVDINVQRAAFGMAQPREMRAAGAFSTFSLPNTLANTANKFLREGWMSVDQTPLRIASIRSVRDFKTITTVSLTGGFQFEKVAAGGEIPHAAASELTYTNKADTYGIMFGITRQDFINDDLSALTAVPRRIGRGGMLKLNDIFWAEFLDNGTFFSSGNANVSTADGTLGLTGLSQAEAIFMAQTDADGKPLGAMPKILLVPTALHTTARQLMTSERIKGDANEPDANVWRGRFQVESSPYMSNTAYEGDSTVAWYLLADPNDIPVIEIAALNGRVEPTVETADADFNVLGIQMRGFSDVGVALQEFRGGVRADGSGA